MGFPLDQPEYDLGHTTWPRFVALQREGSTNSSQQRKTPRGKVICRYWPIGSIVVLIVSVISAAVFETQKLVLAFLAQEGIKEAEIETGQWTTVRTTAQDLKDDPRLPHYAVSSVISVTTHDIEATQSAYRKINDLRIKTKGGVTGSDVSYSFTGVGQLRAEMIAAATKDARNAAVQFAADSDSKVGSIRNASKGHRDGSRGALTWKSERYVDDSALGIYQSVTRSSG
jgi:Protein of unknown function (DUF541)